MKNSNFSHCLKALVVDDDPIIRKIHSKILIKEGYEVIQAEDGEEAVALAQENSFDVMLIDINMPKMNGLDATAKIRAHKNTSSYLTIIGITSIGEFKYSSCIAKGMDIVLDKPITIEKLISVIQQLISTK